MSESLFLEHVLLRSVRSGRPLSFFVPKFLWDVVGNHVVKKGKDKDEIGIRGFGLFFSMRTSRLLLEKY